MKKAMLSLLLLMLCLLVFGQTGLFKLSFNQNYQEAAKSLISQGFAVKDSTATSKNFTCSKIPRLTKLSLRNAYSEGLVSGWTVYYKVDGDAALIKEYKDKLSAMHGVDPWYDDYYEEDVWELDYPYAIYVYPIEDGATLVIEYTEIEDDYYYDDWY